MKGSVLSQSRLAASSLFHMALIVMVALIAYSNTFHVPFQFDDFHNILEKPYVRDIRHFSGFQGQQWFSGDHGFRLRTVGYFTFALNYRLNGQDVTGYHIFNLFIHIINGLLLYRLVVLSFRTPALADTPLKGSPKTIALFTALLFVAHPVQTQAVTYIVQRLTSLATHFYLLSFVAYVEWRLSRGSEWVGRSSQFTNWIFYALSVVAAALAMKTKEIAFTLPVMIALYEFMFMKGDVRKRVLFLIPLLLTMAIIPIGLIGFEKPIGEAIGDASRVTRVESMMPRTEYLYTEFRVIVTYVRLLFFPVNQNLDYDYPKMRALSEPQALLSLLFLLSILCLGAYLLYLSRRRTEGLALAKPVHVYPLLRFTSFGIFWFFITLSVESSVIPIIDVIYEHRLYLPSIGFFIAAVTTLFLLHEKLGQRSQNIIIAALGVVVIGFTGLTLLRNGVWQSEVRLWEDVIEKSPLKPRGYNGLGLAYQREGRHDKAIDAYRRALSIDPDYALAHNGLGSAYFQQNQHREALEQFSRAIYLDPDNYMFLNNRGLSYAALGEFDKAIADYLQAINLRPSYAEAYHNLALVYHHNHLLDKAIDMYDKAIALEPDVALYYGNRALTRVSRGDYDRAIEDATEAIRLDPRLAQAYNTRGIAQGMTGRLSQAISDFTSAISADPGRADYLRNRAMTYQLAHDMPMAVTDFRRACEAGDNEACKRLHQLEGRGR